MCNTFMLSLVPTFIFIYHSGFFLLVGYNLVVQARDIFFMHLCGSISFKSVCALVGMIFLV